MRRKQKKKSEFSRRLDADGSYNRCRAKTWDSKNRNRSNVKKELKNKNYDSNIVWEC